ncbi:hypothetical protein BBJ29_008316 [Phytophthora kernoviae]|uniref:Carboxypeptidase n=1 Tax=Phytophthora kernoviae TaxID=325452 RepID=A0A3F2REY7_9STRA|nr:hypothetical protein BBJ29_008316 [Phytophthora kernoviae]RLN54920.1 hypothetical protein BBP00_00008727 [Phytophthora kernoviae]
MSASMSKTIETITTTHPKYIFLTAKSGAGKTYFSNQLKDYKVLELDKVVHMTGLQFAIAGRNAFAMYKNRLSESVMTAFVNNIHSFLERNATTLIVVEGAISDASLVRRIFSGPYAVFTFVYLYPTDEEVYAERLMKRFTFESTNNVRSLAIWPDVTPELEAEPLTSPKLREFMHRMARESIAKSKDRYRYFVDNGFDVCRGPGEGGTYGLLAENGPCTVNDNLSTSTNPYSWTTVANMVWVDLPANSGFSYSTVAEDDEFTDERVAESVFWFLQRFFKKHRELQGRKLFLVGESYGGHFVPSVAHYIWKKQHNHLFDKADPDLIPINLHGIAIGNGLTDSVEVYSHTVDMAVNNAYNITLVNETQLAALTAAAPKCRGLMTKCQTNTSICQEAGSFWQTKQYSPLLETGRSPYDIRKECETAVWDSVACQLKMSKIKAYLDSPQVREFLGVDPSFGEWAMLNYTINANFFGAPHYSGFISVADKVSDLLNAGLHVLLYVGDADLLCNIYAIKATAEKLKWSGSGDFNATKECLYLTASGISNAGTVRSYSRLTYVAVHNAGHMVPGDQPELALDVISKFIRNETF